MARGLSIPTRWALAHGTNFAILYGWGTSPEMETTNMTRTIAITLLLATLLGIGSVAYSAYCSITRFAESVSQPERLTRSIR